MKFHIEGITEFIKPYRIKGKELLVLSDIHIPFHDKQALNVALDYAKDCDTILLNGDVMDFYKLAKYTKNPRKVFLDEEINAGVEFLKMLRANFKGEILFKIGNHEQRLRKFIYDKAPEFYKVESMELTSMLKLSELNIKLIEYPQIVEFSSLNIFHGGEVSGGGGLANIARSYFNKTLENSMFGHRHQTQDCFVKSLKRTLKGSFSLGCLCDLSPLYMPFNNWNHGFARVSKMNNDKFRARNYRIDNGEIY